MPFPSTNELTLPETTAAPHTDLWVGVGITLGVIVGGAIAFGVSITL